MEVHLGIRDNSTQQLLLNYCFGHRKASILLCPTTDVVLINHNSKKPNAKLRWVMSSENVVGSFEDYLIGSLDELVPNNALESFNTRLMLEYVATRDIKPGEEVFLDYGEEWEEAYRRHLEASALRAEDDFLPASVLNRERRPLVLSQELGTNHYTYECRLYPYVKEYTAGAVISKEEFTSNKNIDPSEWPAKEKAWYRENGFISWYPCRVVEVDNETLKYSIQLYAKPISQQRMFRQYINCPRGIIRFADRAYVSDQHLRWSFRHYIPVPDSLFPLRWRDDYKPGSFWELGASPTSVKSAETPRAYEKTLREVKCGSYVAKSNIPNAGMSLL
jgi:hypothetical protein